MYLSILGLGFGILGVITYLNKLKKNNSPKHPVMLLGSLVIGVALGVVDIAQQFDNGLTLSLALTILFTFFPAFILAVFSFFLLQKKPPLGNITIKVGDKLMPFKAVTSQGKTFSSEKLAGKRTLLKFYRGSWCPYCSAELSMFEEMKSELDSYNVQVVGICNQTPEEIATHIKRDSLSHTLLSDSKLDVIRQYGVEHHKAISQSSTATVTFFGITMPVAMAYQTMPIPTSILIDEEGVVHWIDQLDDYRLRASRERVMAAVSKAFDK